MREKGGNRLVPGPDYRVDALKLSNQAPRVSGQGFADGNSTLHVFFVLIGVAPKHRASFLIQFCSNGLKLFYGRSISLLGNSTTTNMPASFDYFCDFIDIFDDGRGATLTSKMSERNRRNQNCT
ncbi:hypothetical protein TNCV_936591 [Trichonephila clavipes]|nr:hypothetical protein TNCV_936591 [Trichonephila clavipes]